MAQIGCINGLFAVKNILNMIKNHNLPTFVAFSNLVKTFYTAWYKLLIKVLERYKAPPKFCSDIHRMYKYLIVVINIVTGIEEIIQNFVAR